jgi:bla regulator protein blaR1
LQSLLADRYNLKAHMETKLGPAYDLVIAKSGLKIKEGLADEKPDGMISDGRVTAHAMLLDQLVSNLVGWSGRKVIDETGLAGKRFDFQLQWTLEEQASEGDAGPSIFTALEEQLGLKLVPSQAPVKTLVIDHIDRPSPN